MNTPHSPPLVAFASLLVCASLAFGAEIPKGRILEKVACASDAKQTYALYLPSTFEPGRKWPVLYCFDPGARGHSAVAHFQAAAEKFGWIVAGSNNSRNGPWDANAAAISAMTGDVNRYLPIDPKRIYVAGLSGGARVACQVALTGLPQGVIACSAAFAGDDIPGKLPFAFFGTAGVTDFNYRELRRVDRELEDRRAVHRVVIFDGGHEWLPAPLAMEALAWMELQAMRRGTRAKDPSWIQQLMMERTAQLPATPLLDRWRALKSMVADFKGLGDVAALESEVTSLAASPGVRDALKSERSAERSEEKLVTNLLSAAQDGTIASQAKVIADLRRQMTEMDDPSRRAMATRVLQSVASACSEGARAALRDEDYETAAPLLEAVAQLRPERSQAQFDLARARAALGDRRRAIAALQAAIAAGFRDAKRIAAERAFQKLRQDPEFVAVISPLGK